MIETIADRIKLRMEELAIKQVDLINKNVASKGSISLWLSGGAVPSGERLIKLARELSTSEEWLITGKGDKISRTTDDIDLTPIATVCSAPVLSWNQVGSWTGMDTLELLGTEQKLPLVPDASEKSFYLIVKGISNKPFYNEGEYICIDPTYNLDEIETGEMVVVSNGKDAFFMVFIRSENNIYFKALNERWEPNLLQYNNDFTLVGKYVGSYKPAVKHSFI
ncbi:S24 family peptidase [Acinetobacter nosocomialis]|uniref:S24 family peptidase n=1 Tax=Acinetobacter nosocomialis TaxID=106654 RepID=UPI0006684F0E|nr:S24 family peptidase [Acinetobacter nosocomialis]